MGLGICLSLEPLWKNKVECEDAEKEYYKNLYKKNDKKYSIPVSVDYLLRERVWNNKQQIDDAEKEYYQNLSKKNNEPSSDTIAVDGSVRERFWENKNECDAAEKNYYLNLQKNNEYFSSPIVVDRLTLENSLNNTAVNDDAEKAYSHNFQKQSNGKYSLPILSDYLILERFWENKPECDDAEKEYYLKVQRTRKDFSSPDSVDNVIIQSSIENEIKDTHDNCPKSQGKSNDEFSRPIPSNCVILDSFWDNKQQCDVAENEYHLNLQKKNDEAPSGLIEVQRTRKDFSSPVAVDNVIVESFCANDNKATEDNIEQECYQNLIEEKSGCPISVENSKIESFWENQAISKDTENSMIQNLQKELNEFSMKGIIDDSVLNRHCMTAESESEKVFHGENSLLNSSNLDSKSENESRDLLEFANTMEEIHNVPEIEESECVLPGSWTGDKEEMYKQISENEWEEILGSGLLKKRILKKGNKGLASEGLGHPSRSDNVTVSLRGYFQDTLFDEIEELQFVIAESEVIQAIDLCVVLMNTGEVAEIMADPEMAYGSIGLEPHVPPKAAVRFEIELLSHTTAVPAAQIPIEERVLIGRRKKERGNFWYLRQNYTEAVQCYRKANEFFYDEKLELEVPNDRYQLTEELQDLLDDRLKSNNNLAMALMQLEDWDSSLVALLEILKIEPNNEKAQYLMSNVWLVKDRTEEALEIYRRISHLYPNTSSAKTDLVRLSGKQDINWRNVEKVSKKISEAESNKRKFCIKYTRNEKISTTNAVIGVSGVIFAATGIAAYFAQFYL